MTGSADMSILNEGLTRGVFCNEVELAHQGSHTKALLINTNFKEFLSLSPDCNKL